MRVQIKSQIAGVVWPALPGPQGALLLALLFQLDRTQWWPVEQLLEHQLRQLALLLKHAYGTVPFYRQRFDDAGLRPDAPLTAELWRTLPLLTRRDIQSAGEALLSRAIPPQFGRVSQTQTSGSTGEPVKLHTTGLDQVFWQANTLREHHWHQRDLSGKLAAIRVFPGNIGAPPHGSVLQGWDAGSNAVYATGPAAVLSLSADIETQARWLAEHNPDYLLTYPTNLGALLRLFAARGARLPRLRGVTTVGESVTPKLRALCQQTWGTPITDIYSSQELGYIALQCPVSGQYHAMAETVLVEILNAKGEPCAPGEIGRLVISSLHNFAMPLIRYELRDYAEAGGVCACGRGLPTIARILGRSRNLLTLPNGEQRWPLVGFAEYRAVAPIRQYQLIQHTLEEIEVRLVADRPLTTDEEAQLTQVIQRALGWAFRLRFVYFDGEIPRTAGGKFEEFVSNIGA